MDPDVVSPGSVAALLRLSSYLALVIGLSGSQATSVSRDFVVGHRYLNFPIKNGAPKQDVTILVDGAAVVTNHLELAEGKPDWWAFLDVDAWRGKTLTVRVENAPKDGSALAQVAQGDSIKGGENLYKEALRPGFHFSPRRGWMNDPNGLVYFRGEYHLFFQHNPYGWNWDNMTWGHATSPDLVHWTEHAEALMPDELGPIFSGSAVVDQSDTLVAIYTSAGIPGGQSIASSHDGLHFQKYAGNPVIPRMREGNRDPKVFWYEPTHQWIMVLYVPIEIPGQVDEKGATSRRHTIHFLTSPDLRTWTVASIFEGGVDQDHYLYECPDFFELLVHGDAAHPKWVICAADGEYAVGRFDGKTFTAESAKITGVFGSAYYAAQTVNNTPDGRRIQIAWGRAPSPGMPFNQLQLMPCQLELWQTPAGPRLRRSPVAELATLRDGPNRSKELATFRADEVEVSSEVEPGGTGQVEYQVRGAKVIYDGAHQTIAVNGRTAPAPSFGKNQRIRIFVDRTVIEVFASDGLTYFAAPFIAQANNRSVSVHGTGDASQVKTLEVYGLKSIWQP